MLSSSDSEMWPAERGAAADCADDDNASDNACISEKVKKDLLSVLRTQHRGININSLDSCYTDKIGRQLDFREHGFDSLLDMLKTVKEIR